MLGIVGAPLQHLLHVWHDRKVERCGCSRLAGGGSLPIMSSVEYCAAGDSSGALFWTGRSSCILGRLKFQLPTHPTLAAEQQGKRKPVGRDLLGWPRPASCKAMVRAYLFHLWHDSNGERSEHIMQTPAHMHPRNTKGIIIPKRKTYLLNLGIQT